MTVFVVQNLPFRVEFMLSGNMLFYIQKSKNVSNFATKLHWLPQTLRWRHNGRDSVLNHHPFDCLLNRLFRRRWKKTSKLRVTGLCAGNSPVTGEFPAHMSSNAENVSIWWRQHKTSWDYISTPYFTGWAPTQNDFLFTWLDSAISLDAPIYSIVIHQFLISQSISW